jgi:hypothetical protein
MGNQHDSGILELQAQVTMLRAMYIQRSALRYQMNINIIHSNYKKIHINRKYEQESLKLYRINSHQLPELQQSLESLSNRKKPEFNEPKFISKLKNLLRLKDQPPFIDFESPAPLIIEEATQVQNLLNHIRNLGAYIEDLKRKKAENDKKIEENQKKDILIAKIVNEIADIKHYNSFLTVTHEYLGKKKSFRAKERRTTLMNNSSINVQSRYLLRESKKQVQVFRNKIEELNKRIEKKILMHDKRHSEMRYSADLFSHEKELERKLEDLHAVEDRLTEKIRRLRKNNSSVSTYEEERKDTKSITDQKITIFTEFLSSLHRKRYHVSEIPVDPDL